MAGTTTAPATFPDLLRRRSARLHPDDELTPRALRALKRHRLSLDIDPLPSPPKRRKENSVLRNARPKVSAFPRAASSAHGDVQQPQKRPSPSAPLAPKHSSTQPNGATSAPRTDPRPHDADPSSVPLSPPLIIQLEPAVEFIPAASSPTQPEPPHLEPSAHFDRPLSPDQSLQSSPLPQHDQPPHLSPLSLYHDPPLSLSLPLHLPDPPPLEPAQAAAAAREREVNIWKLACQERVDYLLRRYGAETIKALVAAEAGGYNEIHMTNPSMLGVEPRFGMSDATEGLGPISNTEGRHNTDFNASQAPRTRFRLYTPASYTYGVPSEHDDDEDDDREGRVAVRVDEGPEMIPEDGEDDDEDDDEDDEDFEDFDAVAGEGSGNGQGQRAAEERGEDHAHIRGTPRTMMMDVGISTTPFTFSMDLDLGVSPSPSPSPPPPPSAASVLPLSTFSTSPASISSSSNETLSSSLPFSPYTPSTDPTTPPPASYATPPSPTPSTPPSPSPLSRFAPHLPSTPPHQPRLPPLSSLHVPLLSEPPRAFMGRGTPPDRRRLGEWGGFKFVTGIGRGLFSSPGGTSYFPQPLSDSPIHLHPPLETHPHAQAPLIPDPPPPVTHAGEWTSFLYAMLEGDAPGVDMGGNPPGAGPGVGGGAGVSGGADVGAGADVSMGWYELGVGAEPLGAGGMAVGVGAGVGGVGVLGRGGVEEESSTLRFALG